MSIEEENKALVRRVYELCNQKKVEAAYNHYDTECVCHIPDGDISVKQAKDLDAMFFSAFPDINLTIVDIIAEGDRVAYRGFVRTVHTSEFMGVPASGKEIAVSVIGFAKIEQDKIAEWWNYPDRLSWMQQIGALPESGKQ